MKIKKVRKAIQFLIVKLKDFIDQWRNYGFNYAFYSFIWWVCFYLRPPFSYKLSTWAIRKKTNYLDKYIAKHYSDIMERYKSNPPEVITVENHQIWVFWGQGEEQMPPLIKACYKQLTHFNKNVTLVTLDNVNDLIHLSPIILVKVKEGRISWAHFSDIVRNTLLATHGGLWLDATVWVSTSLPINILSKNIMFTANSFVPVTNKSVRFWSSFEWNWSSWSLGTREENNLLFSFVSEMLQAIAEREKCWPDYVIQDYLIYYACRTFTSIRQAMENQPIESKKRNELANMMNHPYDGDIYRKLVSTDFVFKLSFRSQWNKEISDGKQTFYGRILSDIIVSEDFNANLNTDNK